MAPRRTRLPRQRHFSLDRCSIRPPHVVPGNWIAYFTEVGGEGRGRWLRAMVLYTLQYPGDFRYRGRLHWPNGYEVWALDEEDDVVVLRRWEKIAAPPALTPAVLRSWLRATAYYVPVQGRLV